LNKSKNNKQVYLFGTCLIDMLYPEAGIDAASLLELCGYEVIFPQDQTCCGQPPYNSGFTKPATDIAKHTVQLFAEKDIPLIVPSASCAGMIKYHYAKLLESDSQTYQDAIHLGNRTFELIDFLLDKLPFHQQQNSDFCKIALHTSCSAQREMGTSQQWLSILKKLDNVETVIPKQAKDCCGFGGTFSVKSPAISAEMTKDKCQHLLEEKPDMIVSGDSGCLMNISEKLKFDDNNTPCLHLSRFIAQRFGIAHD
jgi:L-lactate dehydrogenase complex protein LldE